MRAIKPYVFWLALCATLLLAHVLMGPLRWTGDEPPYTYQALGVAADHRLYPSVERWNEFLAVNHLKAPYIGVLSKPYQTLATAVFFGPALAVFGLEAARWLCFAAGCLGLWFLWRTTLSRIATGLIASSPAFLAYLRLLYPEMLLFLAVCIALYALKNKRWMPGIVAAAVLPFLHVRALPLSIAFFVVFMWEQRDGQTRWQSMGIYVALLIAFVVFQFLLWGSLAGSAFPTYQPSISHFFERLALQLFGVRHGLILYMPLAIAGAVGLASGALTRQPLVRASLLLLTVYVATFMWSEAGESWSGRFWVAGLPFIAIGIGYFISNMRSIFAWIAFGLLAVLQAFCTGLFIVQPSFFLDNRQASIPYFILSTIVPIHIDLLLPIDASPTGIPAYTAPVWFVLLWLLALVAVFCVATAATRRRAREAADAVSLVLIVMPVIGTIANAMPVGAYNVTPGSAARPLEIRMSAPANIWAIQFMDKTSLAWTPGTYPRQFGITCRAGSQTIQQLLTPARPLVTLRNCTQADAIDIQGVPDGEGSAFLANPGFTTLLTRPLR